MISGEWALLIGVIFVSYLPLYNPRKYRKIYRGAPWVDEYGKGISNWYVIYFITVIALSFFAASWFLWGIKNNTGGFETDIYNIVMAFFIAVIVFQCFFTYVFIWLWSRMWNLITSLIWLAFTVSIFILMIIEDSSEVLSIVFIGLYMLYVVVAVGFMINYEWGDGGRYYREARMKFAKDPHTYDRYGTDYRGSDFREPGRMSGHYYNTGSGRVNTML